MQFKWQLTQFIPLNWRNSKPVGQAVKQLSYNADQGHEFDLVAPGDLGIEKEVLDVLLNLVVVENFLPRADSQAGMAWQTMKWITFCPCHEETYIYNLFTLTTSALQPLHNTSSKPSPRPPSESMSSKPCKKEICSWIISRIYGWANLACLQWGNQHEWIIEMPRILLNWNHATCHLI